MRPPYAYIPRLYAPLQTLTRQSLAPSPALTAVNAIATTKRTFGLNSRMSTSSAPQSSSSPSGPTPAPNDAAAAASSQQEQTQPAEGHQEHHPTKSTSPAPENATSSAPAAVTSTSDSSQQPGKQPLALPPLPEAPSSSSGGGGDSAAITLDLGGQAGGSASTKLDHLGPLVVHQDGTMSRISNWGEMTEIERQNTLRILVKRNQIRLASLRGEANGEGKAEGNGKK